MTIPDLLTQWETELEDYQTKINGYNQRHNHGSATFWSNRKTELELRIEQLKKCQI